MIDIMWDFKAINLEIEGEWLGIKQNGEHVSRRTNTTQVCNAKEKEDEQNVHS